MFWKASRSSNLFHFHAAMDSIGEVDPKAKEWLQKIDPHCWSRTHRAQTYLQLLEFIRSMVMRKLQERKEECDAWRDVLPPRVNARILKNSQASQQLTIISVGDQEYKLLGPDERFAMKLREYHCGCGSWQISGIPCPHAMAVINHICGRQSLKDWVPNFVHQSLSKNAYIQTYRGLNCKERGKLERKQNEAGQGLSYASYVGWKATIKGLAKVTSLQEKKRRRKKGTKRDSSSQQPQPTTAATTSKTPTMPHSTSRPSTSQPPTQNCSRKKKTKLFTVNTACSFYNYLSTSIAMITPNTARLTTNISFDPPCIYSS
ncbi:hypothetical protein Dsin_015999 [Dipteronia sinensis]|uniref:SWIM-type domain-containing protein n=1 Tax=Dipteronia sinensis TaxID=43782 RepID=A0AAE0AD15_9ROSI|nr:hypothetical protein Dsin_015999 [Dipteronia sinensis]